MDPTSSTSGNNGFLAHMSYLCPGLHDKDSKQDISRKTFRFLFQRRGRLIIPLCQRRYCWNSKIVWHWFEDVVRGKRDHLGIHNSGNLIVKKLKGISGDDDLLIIDGQQRVTTTLLLLASLRDALKLLLNGKESPCLESINDILFVDKKVVHYVSGDLNDGEDVSSSRLLPSFCDRKPYFQLILEQSEEEEQPSSQNEITISYQHQAKAVFTRRISEEISRYTTVNEKVDWVEETVMLALDKMGITLCDIVTDINMAQVFLWLQEKSLFGEASLLENKTPGVYFTGADMVRNLVLSPMMNADIHEQEKFYRQYWLRSLEMRAGDTGSLNMILNKFVDSNPTEYVSNFEKTSEELMKSNTMASLSQDGRRFIHTYGKFCSLFEQEAENCDDKVQATINLLAKVVKFMDHLDLKDVVDKTKW